MATTQLVLLGVPAFVVQVTGATQVAFSIDQNVFAPASLITVDLAKNTTLPSSQWAAGVDVDKQTTGGYTTIGPTFLLGTFVGAVYLAQRLVDKYKTQLANWPPSPDDRYQYQAVLRDDGNSVTRYHGFKAQVLSAGVGTLVHVGFISTGMTTPSLTRWIDTADAAVVDPKSNGFTTIDGASPVGTVGALFLTEAATADEGGPHGPKIPHALGR